MGYGKSRKIFGTYFKEWRIISIKGKFIFLINDNCNIFEFFKSIFFLRLMGSFRRNEDFRIDNSLKQLVI